MRLIKSNDNFRFLLFQSPPPKDGNTVATGSTWSLFRIGIEAPHSRSVAIDDDAPVLSFGAFFFPVCSANSRRIYCLFSGQKW